MVKAAEVLLRWAAKVVAARGLGCSGSNQQLDWRRGTVGNNAQEQEEGGYDVWQTVQEQLSAALPAEEYDKWLRPLQVAFDGADLTLLAPSRYVKETVEGRYLERIEELVAGSGWQVRMAIGSRAPRLGEPQRAGQHVRPVAEDGEAPAKAPVRPPPQRHALNAEFRFDTFIAGKANEVAKAAACHVAEQGSRSPWQPIRSYNPLLLYGGVGLGKTHLMHAIGNEILAKAPHVNVVYLPSESFGNEIVHGVRTGDVQEATQRYRAVDVLMIDDIQFFAGRAGFQENFFHVFNALLESGKQLVATSDRYPQTIQGLEHRLRSRIVGGMTAEVDLPEIETCVAILMSKGKAEGVEIPMDVAFHIAEHIRSNVRELTGALQRVIARARFTKAPVTAALVRTALRGLFTSRSRVTIEEIQKVVEEYYNIKHSDMLSKTRARAIARPRQMAMSLAREFTNHSMPHIAGEFGGRDHTTVLHACNRIRDLRKLDHGIAEDHRNLSRLLSQK